MSEKKPFQALIGALAIVVAIIFVAGFSYRWAYYYNFGLNSLLFDFSTQSILISSFELLRHPLNAITSFIIIALFVAIPHFLSLFFIGFIRWIKYHFQYEKNIFEKNWWEFNLPRRKNNFLGIDSVLLSECFKVLTILYGSFYSGHYIGYKTFVSHATEDSNNPLPLVTIGFSKEMSKIYEPILCDDKNQKYNPPLIIGSHVDIKNINDNLIGCTTNLRSWRLIHRNKDFLYIFNTEKADKYGEVKVPITLTIPSSGSIFVLTK